MKSYGLSTHADTDITDAELDRFIRNYYVFIASFFGGEVISFKASLPRCLCTARKGQRINEKSWPYWSSFEDEHYTPQKDIPSQ